MDMKVIFDICVKPTFPKQDQVLLLFNVNYKISQNKKNPDINGNVV